MYQQSMAAYKQVRDHLPFKQGLRRDKLWFNTYVTLCQRPPSIQTRISSKWACNKELALLVVVTAISPLKSKGLWSHLLIWV